MRPRHLISPCHWVPSLASKPLSQLSDTQAQAAFFCTNAFTLSLSCSSSHGPVLPNRPPPVPALPSPLRTLSQSCCPCRTHPHLPPGVFGPGPVTCPSQGGSWRCAQAPGPRHSPLSEGGGCRLHLLCTPPQVPTRASAELLGAPRLSWRGRTNALLWSLGQVWVIPNCLERNRLNKRGLVFVPMSFLDSSGPLNLAGSRNLENFLFPKKRPGAGHHMNGHARAHKGVTHAQESR